MCIVTVVVWSVCCHSFVLSIYFKVVVEDLSLRKSLDSLICPSCGTTSKPRLAKGLSVVIQDTECVRATKCGKSLLFIMKIDEVSLCSSTKLEQFIF